MRGERVLGTAKRVGRHRAALGECPVWVDDRLRWIDCERGQLLTTDPASGATDVVQLPDRPGCIVPVEGSGLACAAGQDVFHVVPGGRGPLIASLAPGVPGRFNDGKCDAAGRLWVGTATHGEGAVCTLYRIEGEQVVPVVPGIAMSNGIGWSPAGSTMYYVDTSTGRLVAFAFDVAGGTVRDRRTLHAFDEPLLPDGLAVDAEGGVWLAIWGGACVVRLTASGEIEGIVRVPTPATTSCTFGGDDGRTLFITTAQDEAPRDSAAGAVFSFATDVSGVPQNALAIRDRRGAVP